MTDPFFVRITVIIKSARSIQRWWTWRGSTSGRTVRTPTGLLMIDLPVIAITDNVDLLLLRLVVLPIMFLVHNQGRRISMEIMTGSRGVNVFLFDTNRAVLLVLLIIEPIGPGISLPFLGHEATRHIEKAAAAAHEVAYYYESCNPRLFLIIIRRRRRKRRGREFVDAYSQHRHP